jgi:hypothetical protein
VAAGAHDQRAVLGEESLAAPDGMFDERRGLEIPVKLRSCHDALRV